MNIEEIRKNKPDGAQEYRIKNGKAIYYRNHHKGCRIELQRWDGKSWSYTRLLDMSDLKPL